MLLIKETESLPNFIPLIFPDMSYKSNTKETTKEASKDNPFLISNLPVSESKITDTQKDKNISEEVPNNLQNLTHLREQIAGHMEEELLRLAIEIAKKVVHREITTDREVILSLIHVALARLQNRTVAYIRLNPSDYQYIITHSDRINTGKTIELVSDPSITRGGCIIETDFGNVDARIEQQFLEIERSLL